MLNLKEKHKMNTSKSDASKKVCIVGAGLVGSMLSIFLAERGFNVDLYEKRPDIRKIYLGGNRTITMSISNRGFKALEKIGLAEKVRQSTLPKYGRMVHLKNGSTNYQQYGRDGDSLNTVNRSQLNSILIDKAVDTGKVNVFFETRCVDIVHDEGLVIFKDDVSGESFSHNYDWIIGADGINSAVRYILEQNLDFDSKLTKLNYVYKELKIPSDINGEHVLDKHCVHVWPNEDILLVALPSHNGIFSCNLFMRDEGKSSFGEINTKNDLEDLFLRFFPTVLPIMPGLFDEYFSNPESRIETVKCQKWNYNDKILLIGDAAHAIVPFFAMGMNAGFEDCTVFDDLMEETNNDISRVIELFSSRRKPDIDSISDLSLKNFIEISSSSDNQYDIKWKLDRLIWSLYPEHWMPLYPMIAFSHIPLSESIDRSARQGEILKTVLSNLDPLRISNEAYLENAIIKFGEHNIKELIPIDMH